MTSPLPTFLKQQKITGLIAYWKFANGADTTEYTGKYNLTKTGSPTIGTDRLGNTAGFSAFSTTKYFSNEDFLDSGLTAWTCFVWFKATGTTRQFMIDKISSGAPYPFELCTDTDGKLGLLNNASYNPGINIFKSTQTVNSGNWTFAVISGDSSGRASLSMNINGGDVEGSLAHSTGADSGSIFAVSNIFKIGIRGDNSEPFINGSIGECCFCNRVLTAAEKKRLYDDSSAQYIVPNILTT